MIAKRTTIRPMVTNLSPFNTARLWYHEHSTLSFEDDLIDYLHTGFVYSGPDCFAMAKIVDMNDSNTPPHDWGWFIRIAVGPIGILITKLPFALKYISFNRRGEERIRVYEWDKLARRGYNLGMKNRIQQGGLNGKQRLSASD